MLYFSYMNISFLNAVYCDSQGNEFAFENLFIQGRNIRYIHIPDNVSRFSKFTLEPSFVAYNISCKT